ncbi:MAG: T9SS type A sorting domain-containing protein, partial [Saprospiraceae bacterium]
AFSNTRLTNCVFERDSSLAGLSGAIYYPAALQSQNTSSLVLDSCVFRKNVSPEGTCLFYNGNLSSSTPGVQFFCRIKNCTFEENIAKNSDGGAYLMVTSYGGKIIAEVVDCVFRNNLSGTYTSTISAVAGSEIEVYLDRCIFTGNRHRNSPTNTCFATQSGTSDGSAINKAITKINNCLFAHNGGGVAMHSGRTNYVTTNITNCTFFENNKYIFVHSWDTLYNQSGGFYNNLFIDNCIVWEPGTDLIKMFYNNDSDNLSMYGYHINHTLLSLQDSTGVPGSLEAFGDGLIFDQYPLFEDTAAGNFRLQVCSPAVGKGNSATLDAGLLSDLDGLDRIRYGAVDLGAYEQQDSCEIVNISEPGIFSGLRIWPNPSASGQVYFQVMGAFTGEGFFRVLNSWGQEIYRQPIVLQSVNMVDLGYLPSGIYQVSVETRDDVSSGKWIKL